MVDLAMSTFEFLTKFLFIWHPWHPLVCIRSDLKPLETDMSDSSYCDLITGLLYNDFEYTTIKIPRRVN